MNPTLRALAERVRDEGGLLAATVRDDSSDRAELGALAADGPRTEHAAGDFALLVEAIREGYLEHYGTPRVVVSDDPDLSLLAGDALYALGLAKLAELGDLEAVSVLADVISGCARAHAEDDAGRAGTVWSQGVRRVSGRIT